LPPERLRVAFLGAGPSTGAYRRSSSGVLFAEALKLGYALPLAGSALPRTIRMQRISERTCEVRLSVPVVQGPDVGLA
jgi:hypothetical protein